jgi:hypothetical protein
MPATSHFVDGKNSLSQQQDTLNFMEQFTASKIIAYSSSEPTANEAILLPVPFGQQPPPLELRTVMPGDQASPDDSIVFQETCWVEGRATVVTGVRKVIHPAKSPPDSAL